MATSGDVRRWQSVVCRLEPHVEVQRLETALVVAFCRTIPPGAIEGVGNRAGLAYTAMRLKIALQWIPLDELELRNPCGAPASGRMSPGFDLVAVIARPVQSRARKVATDSPAFLPFTCSRAPADLCLIDWLRVGQLSWRGWECVRLVVQSQWVKRRGQTTYKC